MSLTTVQNTVIGLILLIVIVVSGGSYLTAFSANDSSLDSQDQIGNFNRTLNKAATVTQSANDIRDSITSLDSSNAGIFGIFNVLLSSAYNGLKTMFGSLDFISTGLSDAMSLMGFGDLDPIVALISLVTIVIIGFAIWAAIARVNV